MVERSLLFLGGALIIVYAILFAYCIVSYILGSIGLYSISKKRNLPCSWMAWIPILNVWKIGNIADYRKHKYGEKSHLARLLLGFQITLVVLSILIPIGITIYAISVGYYIRSLDQVVEMIFPVWTIIVLLALMLVYIGIAITYMVFFYIAEYHIFRLCSDNYVLFTVLSIIFGIAAFFFFAIRNNEDRIEPTPWIPPQNDTYETTSK